MIVFLDCDDGCKFEMEFLQVTWSRDVHADKSFEVIYGKITNELEI